MIDANSQFFAILTKVGEAKQANADALGVPWLISQMGVGDANGTDPIPDRLQTKLINEWRRRPLNQLKVDPNNPAIIIAEQVIPADEGGKWIREIGLYDSDGDLVAVANCAPSFKPLLSQGSGRTQIVRMNFVVTSTGNITLKIDPAVVLATREYVDAKILEELYKLDSKQSVRVATTGNIALTGLQIVDGVMLAAGDRVLAKNQTLAKDNGIYVVPATGAWARATDADNNAEVTSALLVSVEQGATQADTRWQLITDGAIVLGTTALTFQNVTQGFAPINAPALVNPTANTQPQFDNSSKLATTEFVQRSMGSLAGVSVYSGSTVLPLSDVGKYITITGAATVTLPATTTLPFGSKFTIAASTTGAVAVVVAGGGTIAGANNTPSGPTIVLAAGVMMEFIVFGNGVYSAVGGSGASLLAGNGYQKFPSGLIEQWGAVAVADNNEQTVVLPVAFPNAILGALVSVPVAAAAGAAEFSTAGVRRNGSSLSTLLVNANTGPNVAITQSVFWRVWGY
ncbi:MULTISPECIES: phage tail protein [Pseudomonas]|uniref:phage tail protein n=1 Tax=Pseudomonas TaxID=286 RepID=UPI0010713D6D|nr:MULTISPECIES: phage tail protein [Pseudomonas]QBR30805.1 phage tail protein [Pseudomonas sp. S150]UZT94314.1 phage tail protein [Pseudomonas koreensis]